VSEGVTPIEEPGGQPGEGAASSAEGSNGSPSIEKLTEQLAELAARNETLEGKVKSLQTESVGRKKKLQELQSSLGDMTPDQIRDRLSRLDSLESEENLRKGKFEEELEKFRERETGLKDEVTRVQKREAERMIENAILAAAGAQRPLEWAMMPAPGSKKAAIVKHTEDLFEYDPESGEVRHRSATERDEETGERLTTTAFFSRERSKSLAGFFASGQLSGSGSAPKDGEGSAADVLKIRYDDPKKEEKAWAAREAGKDYDIVR
jgi:cell division protein FtsB